jgi:hypothetical protein
LRADRSGPDNDTFAIRFDELGPFRLVIVGLMNRQCLSTSEVARRTGVERSYLRRVRNGTRPITPSSTAIGMIMENHAVQAIEVKPAPLPASHFDELRAAGSDIAILASACEALFRRLVVD